MVDPRHSHELLWDEKSRKELIKTPFILVENRSYTLPDGSELNDYTMVVEANGVSVVAETPEGKLILVRQFRPAPSALSLDLPGGRVEHNEDPLLCAQRELLEETGYTSTEWSALGTLQPSPHRLESTIFVFVAKGCQKVSDKQEDETEFLETVLVDKHELENLIREDHFSCTICIAAFFKAIPQLQ